MSFYKKILILKELNKDFSLPQKRLSGIFRVEEEFGTAEISLSLINLVNKSVGEFYVFVAVNESENLIFPFNPLKPFREIIPNGSFNKGFAVGVFYLLNDLPVTFAFGVDDDFNFSAEKLKKAIAEKCLSLKKQSSYLPYDDEVVATENYFDFDKEIFKKVQAIREDNNERLSTKNELPFDNGEKQTQEVEAHGYCVENEKNANSCQSYYQKTKRELDGVFSKFPKEENLCALFADSKWAKINYSKDKYYVVGVIKEYGVEKYICYGVPDVYSPTPPKALKGYCSFIPLSLFNFNGEGYWMMFQSACDGSHIKMR